MTVFTVTITDPSELAGLTAARNDHNTDLPATIPDPNFVPTEENPTAPEIPNPDIMATDQDYVQFVMERACASYASHYGT